MNRNDRSSLEHIQRSAQRMRRARRRAPDTTLQGLAAFGVIGWSVAIPTVAGALLGLWLDRVAPQAFSWPLALMLGGVVVGALVAWDWVLRENRRAVQGQPPAEPGPQEENGYVDDH